MVALIPKFIQHLNRDPVQAAEQQGLPWVIENPTNSLFWSTSFWASVASLEHIVADLQACAFGGSRPKWTRLVGNFTQLQALARSCPGCVAHAPWGRRVDGSWSTAEKTAYPVGLCTEWASALRSAMEERKIPCISHSMLNRAIRENAQIQSKARLPFKLVDEWKSIVYLVGPRPILETLSSHKRLPQTWEVPADVRALPDLRSLPAGAQVLSRAQKGGWLSPQLQQLVADRPDHAVLRVGVPWSYLEFIREAARVGHPCHKLSETRPLIETILKELVSKPHGVKSHREEWLKKWEARAGALEEAENALKANMSKVRKGILAPKRLLLFKEILADLEYDDMEVVDEIICGGSLVGPVPVTDVLDAKLNPSTESIQGICTSDSGCPDSPGKPSG